MVRNIADRIMVIENGGVVEVGETASLFGSPRHPCTRRLISAVPVIGEEEIAFRERLRDMNERRDADGDESGASGRQVEATRQGRAPRAS